jgi:hypothetical protein
MHTCIYSLLLATRFLFSSLRTPTPAKALVIRPVLDLTVLAAVLADVTASARQQLAVQCVCEFVRVPATLTIRASSQFRNCLGLLFPFVQAGARDSLGQEQNDLAIVIPQVVQCGVGFGIPLSQSHIFLIRTRAAGPVGVRRPPIFHNNNNLAQ